MLDNIPHIKAYWVMMTPRIAQIALRFGADDIDGTIVEERIYHDAGATTTQGLRRAELLHLIRKGGPRAGGAGYSIPAGGADGSHVYGAGVAGGADDRLWSSVGMGLRPAKLHENGVPTLSGRSGIVGQLGKLRPIGNRPTAALAADRRR